MRTAISITIFTCIMVGAFGCDPKFDHLDIDQLSAPPGRVNLQTEPLLLQQGLAVLISVEPVSANSNDFEDEDRVRLRSRDTSVFSVLPGPKSQTFVLLGVAPGSTCMEVQIHNRNQDCINVNVVAE